jgi:hypothetical protein
MSDWRPKRTLRERFDEKWMPEPNTGCWLWTGAVGLTGYSQIKVDGRCSTAHRVGWKLYRGPIPSGLVVDHLCRTRACVNPDHLRLVTQRINATENSVGPTAINAAKTHCKVGHQFTPDNVYLNRAGERKCRMCMKLNQRRRRQELANA